MKRAFAIIAALTVASAAYAHRHDAPELKDWLMGLHDGHGISCCDGSEALRIDDPDWDNDNGHYRVRLEGQWIDVPDNAVVSDPNKYGMALVWPIYINGHPTQIRCFLPGAGA